MKTICIFFTCLLFCSISFAQKNAVAAAKLIKCLKLFPLTQWKANGDGISKDTRDSLITVAISNNSALTYIDSADEMAFFQGYPSFVIYPAKNYKDIMVASLNVDGWRTKITFWQYDPVADGIKDITAEYNSHLPSFKSFFSTNFSFKGRDTTSDNFQVQIIPEKDSLTYGLAWDVQNEHFWLNKVSPSYEWIAAWNGLYFVRKRRAIAY